MAKQGYWQELLMHWRPLMAAFIGLGTGFSFSNYVTSIMAPHLLAEFGWSKSEFAAVSSLSLIMVISFPIVGRLTDIMGVRKTALIGVVLLPLSYVLLSQFSGDIKIFILIFLMQAMFCITTTATVYSRTVVAYIERSRGVALAIVASGPALVSVIALPMLNGFVEANGWRAGYLALATFTGLFGLIALLMLPPRREQYKPIKAPMAGTRHAYKEIFNHRAFWIILISLFLCNLPQVLILSQLNLLLVDNGIETSQTGSMLAALSIGMLMGRFLCGFAIDRFAPHIVAAIGLGGPSVGLFVIASTFNSPSVLTFAVFLLGLSYGAEGDLIGYIVARVFGVKIYSSVMGLATAIIATASASGAILLSVTLAKTDSFQLFLLICGALVFIGGLNFLRMKNYVGHVEPDALIQPSKA